MGERTEKLKKYRRLIPQLATLVVIAATLTAGVMIMFFNSTLGWFAMNRQVDGNGMGVRSSGLTFPQVHAWRFDINGGEINDTFVKDGVWVDGMDVSTADPNDLISVESNDVSGGSEAHKFISLHLGTVDNLLTLSEDNCYYIRLDITDDVISSLGTALRAYYSIEKMTFYANSGVDETSALEDEYPATYSSLLHLVDVDCAVSRSAKAMTGSSEEASAIEAFFTTCANEETSGGTVTITADSNEFIQLDRNGGETEVYSVGEESGETSNAYYIYIRLRPDLATCFEATHDISVYMPCQLVFDISLQFEFYTPID